MVEAYRLTSRGLPKGAAGLARPNADLFSTGRCGRRFGLYSSGTVHRPREIGGPGPDGVADLSPA